jgi:hypothetical protein
MTEFFNIVPKSQLQGFLKWGNDHAPAITPAIISSAVAASALPG